VTLRLIERRKPTQNASIESFNGRFREGWMPPGAIGAMRRGNPGKNMAPLAFESVYVSESKR
jgi:hypothetical protein